MDTWCCRARVLIASAECAEHTLATLWWHVRVVLHAQWHILGRQQRTGKTGKINEKNEGKLKWYLTTFCCKVPKKLKSTQPGSVEEVRPISWRRCLQSTFGDRGLPSPPRVVEFRVWFWYFSRHFNVKTFGVICVAGYSMILASMLPRHFPAKKITNATWFLNILRIFNEHKMHMLPTFRQTT